MNPKHMFDELRQQVSETLDTDRNGVLNFKDLLAVFPNNAVAIAVFVIDLLVAVAEIRVWDFGMTVTGNWMLALGFVAVSALPFYLGELLWLYPRANGWQQLIAGGMVLMSLYTSAQFGLADLSSTYDVTRIVKMVVWLTAAYVVSLIVYVFADEAIKAHRLLRTTKALADLETQRHKIVQGVLSTMADTVDSRKRLEQMFGEGAVADALLHAKGRKPEREKQKQKQMQSALPPGQPQKQYPNWTLDSLSKRLGMTVDEFTALAQGRSADEVYQVLLGRGIGDVDISHKNFRRLVAGAQPSPSNPPRN